MGNFSDRVWGEFGDPYQRSSNRELPQFRDKRAAQLSPSCHRPKTGRGASVEHLVPKARGPLFGELISNLANDACWQEDPNCPSCPLADECPTGQEAPRESLTPARSRTKPR